MKSYLKHLLALCDVHIQRRSLMAPDFVDLRKSVLSLHELAAEASLKPILVDLPLAVCRVGNLCVFEHPYCQAVIKYGDQAEKIEKWLRYYYNSLKHVTAAEFMGLGHGQWPLLEQQSVRCHYYPWINETVTEFINKRANYFAAEAEQHGIKYSEVSLEITDLWIEAQSQQHSRRLAHLKQSIERKGYARHNGVDGDCEGILLIGEHGAACWISSKGHHRKTVAAAMGYKSIPVRISRIIRRTDAIHWKSVREGLISIDIAHQIFDSVIEAGSPCCHQAALEKADSAHKNV